MHAWHLRLLRYGVVHPHFSEIVVRLNRTLVELVPSYLYPSKVIQIQGPKIAGTAFFPGGSGLYLEGRDSASVSFPVGGVMIVGHNFDSEFGFKNSLDRGREILTKGTWPGLLKRLNCAGIPLCECFFTNAFMGLCEGKANKGYKGRTDYRFRTACAAMLKAQVQTQKPTLIVTLGLKAPPLLASLSADLNAWQGRLKQSSCDPKLTTKDINKSPILTGRFEFEDGSEHRSVVVPITHPSDERNVKLRRPTEFSYGLPGEIELIREGWNRSKVLELEQVCACKLLSVN